MFICLSEENMVINRYSTEGKSVTDAVAVRAAQAAMPDERTVDALGTLFKILGDPARIRILNALFHRELSVGDLAAAVGMSASAASHQLGVLRLRDIVKHRKEGKLVLYSLDDDHVKWIYDQGLSHIREKTGDGL
jgi:DNA-binding transcriptional ArsR family regulator